MNSVSSDDELQASEVGVVAGATLADDGRAQAWITLAITLAIYTMNVADRFIFSTLLQPLKMEFSLSDTGVASLNLALGLVLMSFGIPAGILADRMSRRMLLAASTTFFSIMTALGGFATGLPAFVATRMGVGLGEAGCTPPSLALIADRFPPARRGVAMTIFTLGICAGSFLGTGFAGFLSDAYGWRQTMVIFGLLGLPLGVLALLITREPVRGAYDGAIERVASHGNGLRDALAHVYREKALLFVILGGATICTWGWGLLWWTPAYLARTFDLTVAEAGSLLGQVHLVGGTVATVVAAIAMHWLSRRPARVQIWSIAAVIACAAVASIVAYVVTNQSAMVLCLWLFAPVLYMYTGPTYSLINNLSPPHLRAKVVAIFLFATSLGYLILAPMFIGVCSDFFAQSGMDSGASLRRAMCIFAPLGLLAAVAYAVAGFCSGASRQGAVRDLL